MIRAVLFDLDGVVRHFDVQYTDDIERRYGLEPGAVLAAAFAPDLLEQVTVGAMSRRDWVAQVGRAVNSVDAAEEWGRQPFEVDTQVLELVDALRRAGIRTAILTNGTDTIPAEVATLGLHEHFEAIFNSAEIGFAKPDMRAFQHVLHALGLDASQVFFTDDSATKLVGAASLGMSTHHFTSVGGLQSALRSVGVEI